MHVCCQRRVQFGPFLIKFFFPLVRQLLQTRDTHIVAVEGVKDSGDVASQDADGDAGVVQRHPAAAGLLRAVAAEQVVAHRAQQAQLRGGVQGSEKYLSLCGMTVRPGRRRFGGGTACGPTAGRLLSCGWLIACANILEWARLGLDVPVKASTRSH